MICEECKCPGECCRHFRIEVFSSDNIDWTMLYTRDDRFWMKKKEDHLTCVALKDGRCSIHSTRPKVCREFAAGEPRCLKIQAEFV
jgi:Fe-S-cluster containining protein